MAGKVLLVVGATGDIGRGVVRAALARSWNVIGASRSADRLASLAPPGAGTSFAFCQGDIGSEASAMSLWEDAATKFGRIDDVVIAVNAPNRMSPLLDWSSGEMAEMLSSNLLTHFAAARTFLPRLPDTGMLLGIGGGTADFVIPKMAYLSVAQAAQRMLYRGLARERDGGADIRELMIISMVNGRSKREVAKPEWLTDDEVGQHICAVIDSPGDHPGPILQLKTREQVGKPDVSRT